MSDTLWVEAERLASRNYRVDFERDFLSDGQIVYMASNPDLPGCKAQGATINEAKTNLDEVRIDYMYALLEEDLPIPEPRQPVIEQPGDVTVRTFYFGVGEDSTTHEIIDNENESDQSEYIFGLTLGGDLIKNG